MNAHADKTQENKSQSVANSVSNKKSSSESAFHFVDNRPGAVSQRKLQEMVNNAPKVKQLSAYQTMADKYTSETAQRKVNKSGLPDSLKSGIESISGYAMDDVKVHYNSDQPAQLQAHAYAQGTDIHLAPGQEKHLPHEAWHVVQQKQGRVKPTLQMKGSISVNDDAGLEKEADLKGEEALQMKWTGNKAIAGLVNHSREQNAAIQLRRINVGVTGLTHLVKMVNGSIMEGREDREIIHGTPLAIDNENKFRSRRGPNQEIFGQEDKHAGQNYRWFKVLTIGYDDVSAENLYIRDQTFETIAAETVSERPAQISNAHRLRDPHQDESVYHHHFPHKANEMPGEYSSSFRQHVVKQWVETKVRGVISVEEDKRNKGKNNRGVFKVRAEARMYIVKVAVARDSADYERETKKKSEVSKGLGEEAGLFAQIIASERNWHGLTFGLYPEAPGGTLGQGFVDFTQGLLSRHKITRMYNQVAFVLSQFNLKNEKDEKYNTTGKMGKTDGGLRAHNDANPDNILIHPGTEQVTFIDNDGIDVNTNPYGVEKDVSSLIWLFTPSIGAQAGSEFKANNGHIHHQAQEIMDTVLEVINNIKNIYAAKIKNTEVKKLITRLCETKSAAIQAEFEKNKQ